MLPLESSDFEQHYEVLAPAIHAWATFRIPSALRPRLDPEDVVQETWWRALDGLHRFDGERGAFRGWVFGIATRVLLEGLRRPVRGPGPAPVAGGMITLPSALAVVATSISRRAAQREDLRAVVSEMGSLSREERGLFVHCALEGLPPGEAAELLGVSPEAAVKRWQRLRERLRESAAWQSFLADP